MTGTNTMLEAWRQAIDDELLATPSPITIKPADRIFRLYPQYAAWIRQSPLPLASLLTEQRPEVFVQSLYQHILLREPDPDGFQHNLERLRTKQLTPAALLMEFLRSEEGRQVNRALAQGRLYHWLVKLCRGPFKHWWPEAFVGGSLLRQR